MVCTQSQSAIKRVVSSIVDTIGFKSGSFGFTFLGGVCLSFKVMCRGLQALYIIVLDSNGKVISGFLLGCCSAMSKFFVAGSICCLSTSNAPDGTGSIVMSASTSLALSLLLAESKD